MRKHVDSQPKLEAFYRYWRRTLVPEYTRRCISEDEDRLVALQAIAGDIHSRIGDQYCAGLWRKDLIRQLCWRSQSETNAPAANHSPSWSWSSVKGPIVPCLDSYTESTNTTSATEAPGDMEVEGVTCNTLNSNPCGQVLAGCIKICAWALDVRAVWNHGSKRIEFAWLEGSALYSMKSQVQLFPDTPLKLKSGKPVMRRSEDDYDHWTNGSIPNASRDGLRQVGALAVLILVRANYGCVLVCSPTSKANVFRRVGIGLCPKLAEDGVDGKSLGGHITSSMTLRHLDLI